MTRPHLKSINFVSYFDRESLQIGWLPNTCRAHLKKQKLQNYRRALADLNSAIQIEPAVSALHNFRAYPVIVSRVQNTQYRRSTNISSLRVLLSTR